MQEVRFKRPELFSKVISRRAENQNKAASNTYESFPPALK
jgi:hypothetical protein